MVAAIDALFIIVFALGVFLCGLGYVCYRWWDQLGSG